MKKFELEELESALAQLEGLTGPAIEYVRTNFQKQLKEKQQGPFKKASDAYLRTLTHDDIVCRTMEPDDPHYIQGYNGMFEIATGKLLRRHADTLWHATKLLKDS